MATVSALALCAGCTALKAGEDRARDGGARDLGQRDLGPGDLDAHLVDFGVVPDLGPRCQPSPTGPREWPRYRLPGTTAHVRSYQRYGAVTEPTVIDCVTGLEWQREVTVGGLPQYGAVEYCDALAYAYHDDWRLPTTIELLTLLDYARAGGGLLLDSDAFLGGPLSSFWTASPFVGVPGEGWSVDFALGRVHSDGENNHGSVRCVR